VITLRHLFIFYLVLFSTFSIAENDMQDRAKDAYKSIKGKFDSKDALNKNFAQPLMTDGVSMQTLDGTSDFSGRVGCKSENNYLSVNANVNSSGNVTAFISTDSDLNGSIDQNATFSDISVVCGNGFQKCTNGAEDCQTYRWNSSSSITAQLMSTKQEIASVHSCYCVNNACSPNLANNNLQEIIRTIGNGVASAMQQDNPYYTISDVRNSSGALEYFGQDTVSCDGSSIPNLHEYKNNNSQLITDGESSKSDDQYVMVENLVSQTGGSGSLSSCSISRNFSFDPIEDSDVLSLVSGQGSLVPCGLNCLELSVGLREHNSISVGSRCVITNINTRLNVGLPERIISATLVDSFFEEDLNLSTDVGGVIATRNGLPVNAIPSQSCTGSTGSTNNFGGSIDITNHFKQQGMVNLKGTLATYKKGSYYYKIRFIIDSQVEEVNQVNIFAQGRNYLKCDYSLATGSISCTTDGVAHRAEVTNTWDINELCGSQTTISKTRDSNFAPSIAYGQLNTTVDVIQSKTPSCSNDLTGQIEIRDQSGSSDTSHYLSQRLFFTLKKPSCNLVESVDNLCTSYEGRCALEKEVVDGVTTISNMISTGLTPLPSSRYVNGSVCSANVTRDSFLTERSYRCESSGSPINIDTNRFIKPVISGDNVSINMANSGNGSGSFNMPMPELPTHSACIQSCEVRSQEVDTRVNLTGVVSDARNDNVTYKKSYRSCDEGICPVQDGEEVIQSCGCLNEFGKAMGMMQLIRLAGKDMICTDGNTTTDQP